MLQKYRIKICNITKMYGRGNFRMSGLELLSLASENLFSLIQFSIFSLKIYKLSLGIYKLSLSIYILRLGIEFFF